MLAAGQAAARPRGGPRRGGPAPTGPLPPCPARARPLWAKPGLGGARPARAGRRRAPWRGSWPAQPATAGRPPRGGWAAFRAAAQARRRERSHARQPARPARAGWDAAGVTGRLCAGLARRLPPPWPGGAGAARRAWRSAAARRAPSRVARVPPRRGAGGPRGAVSPPKRFGAGAASGVTGRVARLFARNRKRPGATLARPPRPHSDRWQATGGLPPLSLPPRIPPNRHARRAAACCRGAACPLGQAPEPRRRGVARRAWRQAAGAGRAAHRPASHARKPGRPATARLARLGKPLSRRGAGEARRAWPAPRVGSASSGSARRCPSPPGMAGRPRRRARRRAWSPLAGAPGYCPAIMRASWLNSTITTRSVAKISSRRRIRMARRGQGQGSSSSGSRISGASTAATKASTASQASPGRRSPGAGSSSVSSVPADPPPPAAPGVPVVLKRLGRDWHGG